MCAIYTTIKLCIHLFSVEHCRMLALPSPERIPSKGRSHYVNREGKREIGAEVEVREILATQE